MRRDVDMHASSQKIVISASRRTDIPAFYMSWFMAQIASGRFRRVNPYNRRVSYVAVDAVRVHSIVFWSKNYAPLINGAYDRKLEGAGYRLFFNFTVNSQHRVLEPGVPSLATRLHQLEQLCRRHDPRAVVWRFDPLCFYRLPDGRRGDNFADFYRIAEKAAACGVRRCITSFVDDYAKIRKRLLARGHGAFIDPPMAEKVDILLEMARTLEAHHMTLYTCCEKQVQAALPPDAHIRAAACIPGELLVELFGGGLAVKRDAGQRVALSCGCQFSVDIGSYALHPCFHDCLFCYANPVSDVCHWRQVETPGAWSQGPQKDTAPQRQAKT